MIHIKADHVTIERGPLPVLGARVRRFSAMHSVSVRFNRVVSLRGGVADTHAVEATISGGHCVTLDLVARTQQAQAMAE